MKHDHPDSGLPAAPFAYEELEARIAFDGALAVSAAEAAGDDGQAGGDEPQGAADSDFSEPFGEAAALAGLADFTPTPSQIVFIDGGIGDLDTVLNSLADNMEAVILDPARDGVEQMAEYLLGQSDIEAIHIISHGSQAELFLGTASLNLQSMSQDYAADLMVIGNALSADADILVYGCNFGAGELGLQAAGQLASLTGADVAASDDMTGYSGFGADWDLEVQVGAIETEPGVNADIGQEWEHVLTDVTVTTTSDVNDGDTSSIGALLANKGADGSISLREAIIAANNTAGADTITLVAGTYTLGIAGQGEDLSATGDLDISDNLTINGDGMGSTIIDANGIDRAIEIISGSATFNDLTVTGGDGASADGGGFNVHAGATLALNTVDVNGNVISSGGGSGGGIASLGTLIVNGGYIRNGSVSNGDGGGVWINGGTASLSNVAIVGNTSSGEGGGIKASGGVTTLANVTVSGNTSNFDGGGIAIDGAALQSTYSTIADNQSLNGWGGGIRYYNGTGSFYMQATIVADNTDSYGSNDIEGNVASLGYNIVEDASGSGGFVASDTTGVDPNLDVLADNGGNTLTHALLAGSIAIDANASSAPATDQRGVTRDASADIGAFEYEAVNQPPVITSNGGGASASVNAAENQTAVTTVTSTDPEGDTPTYSISGGADAAKFAIDSATGVLSFITAPDYETPGDVGGDNVYDVQVQVSDGNGGLDAQDIAVTVTNVNEAPVNSIPGAQTTDINSPLILSSGTNNALVISDVDAGGSSVQVTLTASNGTMTLSGTTGLSFSVGDGTADGTMTFTGTISDINAALDGMSFNPATSYQGAASITISTDDLGNSGSGPALQDIDVLNIQVGAVQFQQGVNGYTGTLDTYTSDSAPSTSYGSEITVLSDKDAPIATGLLSFQDLFGSGPNQIPYGSTINSATISIYVTNHDHADAVNIHQMLTSWDESSTYNSLVNGVQTNDIEAASSSLTTIDSGQLGWVDITGLAAMVQSWSDGGDNYGIAFVSDTADHWTFASSEYGTVSLRPYITIDYTAPQPPVITSNGGGDSASVGVAENQTGVTTVTSTDPDGGTPVYSISGGADAGKFSIDSATGVLSFITAPDFETPTDTGGDNVYDVQVQVSDGNGGTDVQDIAVTVTNVNEPPVITSDGGGASASVNAAENQTGVTTVTSTDVDGGTPVYSISGGADAAKFTIDSVSGVLSFIAAPDYETPADVGGDNVYDVQVEVSDGNGGSDVQDIAVTVTDANDAPVGVPTISGTATENQTLTADPSGISDQDGLGSFAYQWLRDGVPVAGATSISYVLGDADVGAQMSVQVSYTDGGGANESVTSAQTAAVANVNDAPAIVIDGSVLYYSGTPSTVAVDPGLTITDVDSPNLSSATVSFGNGFLADQDRLLFTDQLGITGSYNQSTGVLTLTGTASLADYQTALRSVAYEDIKATPTSGRLDVNFTVNDGVTDSAVDTRTLQIDSSPTPRINNDAGTVDEGNSVVIDLLANDSDPEGILDPTSIVIVSPPSNGSVVVNGDGTVTYTHDGSETVSDSFTYTVEDSSNNVSNEALVSMTVNPVNDAPAITSDGGGASAGASMSENQTLVTTVTSTDVDGGTPSYTISGGADAAKFTIDSATGVLSFITAPDFEVPADAGGDNVYDVQVQVSDGHGGTDVQDIAVTVTDVNDAPVITSNGGGASAGVSAAENQTAVTTVTSTDDDGDTPVYSISGGADAGKFAIDSASGVLTFITAPDFETPTDAGGDNVYDVQVQVSDGNGGTDVQDIAVTLTNVNEPPVITSNGGGASASVSAAENQTAVTTVTSTDVDGGTPVYSISGGADAGKFTIDSATGVLTFISAPDYEAPGDVGGDNVYDVQVQVSDGNGGSDVQDIAVTLTNVNEPPVITSNGGGASASVSAAENQTAVTTVTSSDVDGGTPIYSISGGADAGKFAIDSVSGVLTFIAAPDYETPTDVGGDNVYDVQVQVSDGNGGSVTQDIAVSVTNVNEPPVITSDGGGASANLTLDENLVAVTTVTSTDVDGDTPIYSISGGADAGKFTIDSATGALRFISAPDYEAPADVGGDNVYEVQVQVSDGNGGSDVQDIAVTIEDVFDDPVNPGNPDTPPPPPPPDEIEIDLPVDIPTSNNSGTDPISVKLDGENRNPLLRPAPAAPDNAPSTLQPEQPAAPGDNELEIDNNEKLSLKIRPVEIPDIRPEPVQHPKIDNAIFWNSVDKTLSEITEQDKVLGMSATELSVGLGTAFTTGFVSWLLRGGTLLSTLLTTMPAWRGFDPLTMIVTSKKRQDERLSKAEKMFSKANQPRKKREVKP